jgi:hypothetical protein
MTPLRIALQVLALVVVVGIVWWILQPPPLTQQFEEYGVIRGRLDAKARVHRPEDVDDQMTAMAYVMINSGNDSGQDSRGQELTKEMLSATKSEQAAYVRAFAKGYKAGYAKGKLEAKPP